MESVNVNAKDLIDYINDLIEQNENYCIINSCVPSPYMEGSNRAYKNILEYIERKKK